MDIVKKPLTNGQYLTTVYEKKSMFLHHTVSTNAMSAWRWWNSTPERVGTPYIIDRDGTIFECFDPKVWAFHLGIVGDDNWHEKHSINIEIVSAGPIREVDGDFRFYPLWPNKTRWTSIPADEVHIFSKPWKGHKHWHLYSEDQLESLKWLIGRLALDFPSLEIDNNMDEIFDYDGSVVDGHTPGIWTHNTVKKPKSDPFPYPPLIKALKSVQSELTNIGKTAKIPEVTVTAKKTVKKPKSTKPKSSSKKSKP